jgi:transposase
MKPSLHTVAIDLAKTVFHLVGADTTGKILWRKHLTRHALMPCIARLPPVRIGIEARGGAHDWARRFREHGHEVKRMAPQFVTPCVKSNKHDRRDAEAIAEAVTRPTRRVVPPKDIDQQDLQALHRVRERLMGERTALINDVHGPDERIGDRDSQRGVEVPSSRGGEARVREGHAHGCEPGDVWEAG